MADPHPFDAETGVTPVAPGSYGATLHDAWTIGSAVNGGVVLATAARAAAAELDGHPHPLAVTGYYLSAAQPGPATVSVEPLRRGGSVSTVMASVRQGDEERLRVLATYGDLDALPGGEVLTTATPPDLPPPEDCVPSSAAPPELVGRVGLLTSIDLRLDPSTVGWAVGQPSGRGMIQGWFRLPVTDGAAPREPDPLLLLLAADALPPVSFDLGMPGWAPTLELTVHVRAQPVPGWLRLRHATRNVADGMMEEDAEVWDSAGRLVAQGRQLARTPRRRPA